MPSHLRPLAGLAAIVAVGALVLTGCASAAGSDTPAASAAPGDAAAFPVTFDHVYGETTIEAAPERIATWGWGATDAVLALGIVPVAISSMDYGGGEDRITPWVEDAIEELGGEKPAILDNATYELSVEELLAADPDVLIAPYSGLAQVKDAAAAHPEFAGTSIAYIDDDVDTLYLYLPSDPRVEILQDLGFVSPPSVTDLDTGEGTFYTTVSYESLDRIDAQVLFTQDEQQASLDDFLGSDHGRLIPAVQSGAVAAIVGEENVAAVSPTALSLPWLLPTMVEKLATATATATSGAQ